MTYEIINIGTFILIIVVTILLGFVANRFLIRLIDKSTTEMNNDPTNYKFLRRIIIAGIYITGFSIAIYKVPQLNTLASSLLAGAGILAVAVGFASQQALSNVISGFFIVIFKPFRINDILRINEKIGVVEDITLRHVVIRDYENRRIVIPNSVISNESLINSNLVDERVCRLVDIGISYKSSIQKAREIIKEEALKHPSCIDPRTPEQLEEGVELIPVRVINMGDSAIQLRAWIWAKDNATGFQMTCDLLESIKMRFDDEGVEIPFPQRDVHLKSSSPFDLPTHD